MGLKTWAVDRFLGAEIEQRVESRVSELREATSRQREDAGWRRLTDAQRDLAPVTQDRMREIAVYLWVHNPVARRIINAMVEWIVGEGITFDAGDEVLQTYLGRFWRDPVNRWEMRTEHKVRELMLFGEQFWPAFANEHSGLMRLGVLDPSRVAEVITDPDNSLVTIGVITRQDSTGHERRFRTVLRGVHEEILSGPALAERERFGDGEIFNFAVGNLSGMKRGLSELFSLADWLDGYEQLLFSLLNQERARANYLWDVTLEGADQNEIDEFLKNTAPPKPFSLRAHNEKVKWQLVGPDAGAGAHNDAVARLFRNHVLGGGGIPEHWYGGGGDVNRATASEMNEASEKSFTAKQRTVKYIIEDVLNSQAERGIEVGALSRETATDGITVNMPDLSTRDLSRIGNALQGVAVGMATAKDEGWMDDDTAVQVLASMISHTGVEADPQQMLERAREQREDSFADEASRALDRRLRRMSRTPTKPAGDARE